MSNAKGQRPTATESTMHYTTQFSYDASGNVEYLGKANISTSILESGWQIKKFSYDSGGNAITIEFAGGTDAYDKTWDDRITYSYS